MITTEVTETEVITASDTDIAVVFDRIPELEQKTIELSQKMVQRAMESKA